MYGGRGRSYEAWLMFADAMQLLEKCACRVTSYVGDKLSPVKLQNPSFKQLALVAGVHALCL